ncbi:Uncharacterized protein APZ42_033499 [Daphnia magna]|uniref:Uncharacterized protein n=1 Tax=Daphnia magna TaxID=35525 RepID=A0A164L2A7_9CRUS|nr:Uncharacterized protein APZ42_033499 [Daphnia magna]
MAIDGHQDGACNNQIRMVMPKTKSKIMCCAARDFETTAKHIFLKRKTKFHSSSITLGK